MPKHFELYTIVVKDLTMKPITTELSHRIAIGHISGK